jgi:hypothetical protein
MSMRALALGHRRCPRLWRDHRTQAEAAGADALDQRALRHQFNLDLARDHLRLGFRVRADVAGDDAAHQARTDQQSDAQAGLGGVVGDDRQALLALAHDLVHQAVGRAHAHEAADHQHRPVGDALHCVGHLDALAHD